jgi:4-amino-4-deoxy-L-arabinose transferase-like glycosyltransferase
MRRLRRQTRPAGASTRASDARTVIVLLLFVALAARVAYVLDTWKFIPFQDAHSYDWLARGLANGHGWAMGGSAYRPPGYPIFLGFIYKVIGVPAQSNYKHIASQFGGWTGVRIVEACVAAVTVGLIGWLAHQIAGRRTALVALGVGAIYLPLIVVGVSLMTESLLVPLTLASVNCALRARVAQKPLRWIVLAGLFAGLAGLTRGNGVVVGIALAFVVWTGRPRWSRRSLASPVLLLATMALTIAPWTIRNAVVQHAFIPVTTELGATLSGTYNTTAAKHHYIWTAGFQYRDYRNIRNNKRLTEAQRNSKLTAAVLKFIGKHPTAVPQAMFWNTVRLLDLEGRFISRRSAHEDVGATRSVADLSVYSFWIVGLLALGGIFTRTARRVPRSLWLVPLFVWLSEAAITTGTPRFRAALDPWFILLAAMGLLGLARLGARIPAWRRPPGAAEPAGGNA